MPRSLVIYLHIAQPLPVAICHRHHSCSLITTWLIPPRVHCRLASSLSPTLLGPPSLCGSVSPRRDLSLGLQVLALSAVASPSSRPPCNLPTYSPCRGNSPRVSLVTCLCLSSPPLPRELQQSNKRWLFIRAAVEDDCAALRAFCLLTPHPRLLELKETHLSPLGSFGRSTSTSTITDKDDKAQSSIAGSASPTPSDNNIGTSSHPPRASQPQMATALAWAMQLQLTCRLSSLFGSPHPSPRHNAAQARDPRRHHTRGQGLCIT